MGVEWAYSYLTFTDHGGTPQSCLLQAKIGEAILVWRSPVAHRRASKCIAEEKGDLVPRHANTCCSQTHLCRDSTNVSRPMTRCSPCPESMSRKWDPSQTCIIYSHVSVPCNRKVCSHQGPAFRSWDTMCPHHGSVPCSASSLHDIVRTRGLVRTYSLPGHRTTWFV